MKISAGIHAPSTPTAHWPSSEGADVIFAPTVEEIYPAGTATFVEVEGLSSRLDGASRPGHFRGVATVVTKLLIAAEPDLAFFGQKDAAQVSVLRRMATDLRLGNRDRGLPDCARGGWAGSQFPQRLFEPRRAQPGADAEPGRSPVESLFAAGERRSGALIAAARQYPRPSLLYSWTTSNLSTGQRCCRWRRPRRVRYLRLRPGLERRA